jgi:hypothetical protein
MMVEEMSFTNLIKVSNTMIAEPEGSALPVPTTGHDSANTFNQTPKRFRQQIPAL